MAYNVFKSEFVDSEDSKPIKKGKGRVVYTKKHRTGKIYDYDADKKRTSMSAGKRISKNNKVYYEYRKNRTDVKGLGV